VRPAARWERELQFLSAPVSAEATPELLAPRVMTSHLYRV